jgi:malonyl CoA-acyl carrier protein transacylase
MLTFIFPGQGSQNIGMGAELFDAFPDLVAQADAILSYSIKTLCLKGPEQQLSQTQYTQPAIYVVNALTYLKKLREKTQKPDFVAGHSLGEYNALFAAGVFDFVTGLKIVKKRAELMSTQNEGGMAAVVGITNTEVKNILIKNNLSDIFIANYNAPKQQVLSGAKNSLEKFQTLLGSSETIYAVPLRVSGAFHSPYMSSIQPLFQEFLEQYKFSVPCLPVLANVDTAPYHPASIKENLVRQLSNPVQWLDTMEYLLRQNNMVIEEVGAGNILTNILLQIKTIQ